jgi:hypothetical protein
MLSVAQYAIHVHMDQVWSLGSTGSMSLLDQTFAGARAEGSFGSSHDETEVQRASSCSLDGTPRMIELYKTFDY